MTTIDTADSVQAARPGGRSDSAVELGCYAGAVIAWAVMVLWQRNMDPSLLVQVVLVTAGLGLPIAGLLHDRRRRAVAGREFASFFYSPIAYVVLAVFTFLSSLFFNSGVLNHGQPIDVSGLFLPMVLWGLIPITPAISMRLFAEEHRSGNIETLVTAPVTDAQLVLGKWLGALGFLTVTLTVSLLLVLLLEIFGNPDYGPIFTGYIGMLLLGGLFLAIGTFTSVITRNQIIAFIGALIVIALLVYLNLIVTNNYLTGRWAEVFNFINPYEHYRDFARGVLDTGDFIFLISTTAMFLVFAVKALESRKWR